MQELTKEQSLKVTGGGLGAWGFIGIGILIVFLSGVITGYVNPNAYLKNN